MLANHAGSSMNCKDCSARGLDLQAQRVNLRHQLRQRGGEPATALLVPKWLEPKWLRKQQRYSYLERETGHYEKLALPYEQKILDAQPWA